MSPYIGSMCMSWEGFIQVVVDENASSKATFIRYSVKIWHYLLHTFSLHISPRYAFSGTPGKVTNRFVNSTARACLVDEFTLTLSSTSVSFHYSRFLIYFFPSFRSFTFVRVYRRLDVRLNCYKSFVYCRFV